MFFSNKYSHVIDRHQINKKLKKILFKSTFFNANTRHSLCKLLFWFSFFFGIAYQGKDIVFGFIIEYNNLTVFGS
jgi:hypothetical protein